MRVGITVSDPATVVAEARRAEALGFDILGCGEHLFFHGPTPNSFAMLAAAAAVTSRIRLVSSIALLPLYPAVVVAKMASVIDSSPMAASNWASAPAASIPLNSPPRASIRAPGSAASTKDWTSSAGCLPVDR
jgi:hypothetical protein